jgi:hypothetical protein
MSKTDRSQQLLNWLNKEKKKDQIQLDKEKETLINEIKGLSKEELFPKNKKKTLWQKIKIILGH